MEYYWVPAQVPSFGNWDYNSDLPITQYFDSARQPGLLRHSSSSGDGDLYAADDGCGGGNHPPRKKAAARGVRSQGRERKQQPAQQPAQQQQVTRKKAYEGNEGKQWSRRPTPQQSRKASAAVDGGCSKAVDEDLYQIPPDLLYASAAKRKKRFGFIIGCLNPTCAA